MSGTCVQTSADDLKALFAGAGHVVSVHLITDRDTGRAKGFAFIQMASDAEVLQAIALYNGHSFHDQVMTVNEAHPRETLPASAQASPVARPKFREVKHKRRGGANRNRYH